MPAIGLVLKEGLSEAVKLGNEVCLWAKSNNYRIFADEISAKLLTDKSIIVKSKTHIVLEADPVISLGGDGTLIGVARYATEPSPLFVGVNFGLLGFLTEISPKDLIAFLPKIVAKEYEFTSRVILNTEIIKEQNVRKIYQAINDVVIQKGAKDPLLNLDLYLNGEHLMRLRADGLIISTQTGSTAYSLAAGGSIVLPEVDVLLLTPICPHSLTSRPIIIPIDSTVSVVIPENRGDVLVTFDGQDPSTLVMGDRIVVAKSSNAAKFIRSAQFSYFELLRKKLNWGVGNIT